MSSATRLDKVIRNVRVVRPNRSYVEKLDLGIKDGKFAHLATLIDESLADEVVDAEGLLGFPGVVDAHTHVGIYRHVSEDAPTETRAAASGGVTAMLTNFRTGSLYLEKGGPYRDFYPEVLEHSAGSYHVDYGYNIAPIEGQHVGEMEMLLTEFGVPTFSELFMFYGGHGLHGRSDTQRQWLMLGPDDHYDLAYFEFIMREAARLIEAYPEMAPYISVGLHCEVAELLRAYEGIARRRTGLKPLGAYSEARPPHNEALAIAIAGQMAHYTGCRNINLLHLSSRAAVEAALTVREAYPEIDFGMEATAGHLLLDTDCRMGVWAKVNPPIRPRADVEYLWERVLDGTIEWIVTDHANCPRDMKLDAEDPDNIWGAKAGFGGIEYLLPGIFSEGSKRGLSYNRMAELLCWNPSRRFGVLDKGDIDIGYDADLALLDPGETWTIRAEDSPSAQGYTPFEGIELTGRVKRTFLRGDMIFDGEPVGEPAGRYLKRPLAAERLPVS
jgi:allantoinase